MTRMKSYFANTVEEALTSARRELGEEALLIESRRSRPGEEHLGAYEVIFAAPNRSTEPTDRSLASESPGAYSGDPRLSEEITAFRCELERMSAMLAHAVTAMTSLARAELEPLAAELLQSGLSPHHVQEIVHRIPPRPAPDRAHTPSTLRACVVQEIERRLVCDPMLASPSPGRQVAAFVGPPGSGKTTTLAKLALKHGMEKGKSVAFITTDTYRIAAAGQLQHLASILGVPCMVVEHGAGLTNALDELRTKDLVLIDTPGFSSGEWDVACDWSRSLLSHASIAVHLVLNACTRVADLDRMTRKWRIFDPDYLLFTHLDEASSTGGILSSALEAGLPLSFVAAGQSIPEDIEPASAPLMLAFLSAPAAARSATA